MQIKEIKDINSLMKWIDENIEKPMTSGGTRDEAEWFLACTQAEGWCENRTKDNAYFILEGITPLKGSDEVANEIISDQFWQEDDEAYNIECLEINIKTHWGTKCLK